MGYIDLNIREMLMSSLSFIDDDDNDGGVGVQIVALKGFEIVQRMHHAHVRMMLEQGWM